MQSLISSSKSKSRSLGIGKSSICCDFDGRSVRSGLSVFVSGLGFVTYSISIFLMRLGLKTPPQSQTTLKFFS
jgi:hypothetical protein